MAESLSASPLEIDTARSLLDQLLADSRLYRKGSDYKNLLDFAVRLRNFAPLTPCYCRFKSRG